MHALADALQEKTASYEFVSGKEVTALTKVAEATPVMVSMGPTLAAGLLNNEEADVFVGPVLKFVAAMTGHLAGGEAAEDAEPEPEPETGADAVAAADRRRRSIDAAIDALTQAAKSWIRRRHAEAPERPTQTTTGWGTGWGQPVQPTEEELAEERWKGICSAMDDVNDLLQIPALAA